MRHRRGGTTAEKKSRTSNRMRVIGAEAGTKMPKLMCLSRSRYHRLLTTPQVSFILPAYTWHVCAKDWFWLFVPRRKVTVNCRCLGRPRHRLSKVMDLIPANLYTIARSTPKYRFIKLTFEMIRKEHMQTILINETALTLILISK